MFLFREIREELKGRLPFYWDDWKQGFQSIRILASTLFMYFTSVAPAIAFGVYLTDKTAGQVGTVEVLLSTSLTGVLFAIFGGQPLVIVGVTGPVSIFTVTVFDLSKTFGLPFLPWLAWAGIWSAAMHVLLAITNACNLIKYVTRFSCEIFGCLIAVIYVANAIDEFIFYFDTETLAAAMTSLVLGLGTFALAYSLNFARNWIFFNSTVRGLIADYAAPVAILNFSAVQFFPKLMADPVPRLVVPDTFKPTADRPWIIDLLDIPTWGIFAAIFPGAILTALFFFDHNVSSILSQKKDFNLKKPSAYNWDFFVIGLLILLCSVIGIPPTNGLIPQAPLHVRSLAKIKEMKVENKVYEVWESVMENRLSNFLQALLIGLTLTPPLLQGLSLIPRSVFSGLFLFMGFASKHGNQLWDRMKFLIMDSKRVRISSSYVETVSNRDIFVFTLIQTILLILIYVVTRTPAAISFPIFILVLVPIRYRLLPCFFSDYVLAELDAEPEPEEPLLEQAPQPDTSINEPHHHHHHGYQTIRDSSTSNLDVSA